LYENKQLMWTIIFILHASHFPLSQYYFLIWELKILLRVKYENSLLQIPTIYYYKYNKTKKLVV